MVNAKAMSTKTKGKAPRKKETLVVAKPPKANSSVTASSSKSKGKSIAIEEEEEEEDDYSTEEERGKGAPTDAELYTKLISMSFEQAQFVDPIVIEKMEIVDDVALLLTNMGLGKFGTMKKQAHQVLSCKFLATLRANFYDEDHKKATPQTGFGEMEFKIDRNTYRMTFHELSELFGFPEEDTSGGKYFHYPKKELTFLWETIASGTFKPGVSKNSSIRNPAIRYVHKVLAHMLFGKVEFGTVALDEMELLGLGLKPFLMTFLNGKEFKGPHKNPGLASILVRHLLYYKAWAWGTKGKRVALSIGWLITPILMAKGVKLSVENDKWRLMDEAYLARTKFFKGAMGSKYAYNLKLHAKDPVQLILPNPSLTNILEKKNISFYPTNDNFYNPVLDPPIQTIRLKKKELKNTTDEAPLGSIGHENEDAPPCPPKPTYGGERYSFDPYDGTMSDDATSHAHHQTRLLQRWCKWQDRTIRKLVKSVKSLKKKVTSLQGPSTTHDEEGPSATNDEEGTSATTLVVYEGDKAAKRKAMRSPSPCSSNPSYSMGSSSSPSP